jgi:hypothetical protein
MAEARTVGERDRWSLVTGFLGEFRREMTTWYRANWRRALVVGAIGLVLGWVVNIAIMAVRYDGFRVPRGAPATGVGNTMWGSVFWLLAPALVTGVVGYRLRVGSGRFWSEVRALPETAKSVVRMDGEAAAVHALWGFAGAMVVTLVIVPSVSGLLAAGLLMMLFSGLRPLVVGTAFAAWEVAVGRLKPATAAPPTVVTLLVGGLGAVGALAVGWLVGDSSLRLLLALAAGAGAWSLGRRSRVATTALAVLAGAAVTAHVFGGAVPAWADDGGFKECGNIGLWAWIRRCGGSGRVIRRGFLGGLFSGISSIFGLGTGETTGGEDGDEDPFGGGCDPPPDRPVNQEQADRLKWRQNNPGRPVSDYWAHKERINELRAWEQRQADPWWKKTWDGFNGYNEEVGKALYQDYESGSMADRLSRMPNHVVPGLIKAGKNFVVGMGTQAMEMGKAGGPGGYALKMAKDQFNQAMQLVELGSYLEGLPPDQRSQVAGEMLNQMAPWWNELKTASLKGDNETVARMITEAGMSAEFDALLGGAMVKGLKMTDGPRQVGGGTPEPGIPPQPRPPGMRPDPPPHPTRTREEILGGGENVKITPDEGELLGLEKEVSLNLWETNMKHGGWQEFKVGTPEGVARRREGGIPKPNGMHPKSLSPEEAAAGNGKPGQVAYRDPGPEPPGGTPEHAAWQRRAQEYVDERANMAKLETEGGKRLDENGNWVDYHAKPDGNGIVREVESGKEFVTDIDTYDWDPGNLSEELSQSFIFKQSWGKVAGEGRTPAWDPKNPVDGALRAMVMERVEKEGRVRVDADGIRFCLPKSKKGK